MAEQKATKAALQVWPSPIEFRDVVPSDTPRELQFFVMNTDLKGGTKKVKVICGQSQIFSIIQGEEPIATSTSATEFEWAAVCGLKKTLKARFMYPSRATSATNSIDPVEFHHFITVECPTGSIEVPIHAFGPSADWEIQSLNKDGATKNNTAATNTNTTAESSYSELSITKGIDLGSCALGQSCNGVIIFKNNGSKRGSFNIKGNGIQISCTPTSGVVEPSSLCKIQLHFEGTTLGRHSGEIEALLEGGIGGTKKLSFPIKATVSKHSLELLTVDGTSVIESIHFGTVYNGKERSFTGILVNTGPQPVSFSALVTESRESSMTANVVGAVSSVVQRGGGNEEGEEEEDKLKAQILGCFSSEPVEGTVEALSETPIKIKFSPLLGKELDGTGISGIPCECSVVIGVVETGQTITIATSGKVLKPKLSFNKLQLDFGDCSVGQSKQEVILMHNDSNELPVDFKIPRIAHYKIIPEEGSIQPLQSQEIQIFFKPQQLGKLSTSIQLCICGGLYTYSINTKSIGIAAVTPTKEQQQTKSGSSSSLPKLTTGIVQVTSIDQQKESGSKLKGNAKYTQFLQGSESSSSSFESQQQQAEQHQTEIVESPSPRLCLPKLAEHGDRGFNALPSEPSQAKQRMEEDAAKGRIQTQIFKSSPTTQTEVTDCRRKLSKAELFQYITCGNKKLNLGQVILNAEVVLPFIVANALSHSVLVSVQNTFNLPEIRITPDTQVIPQSSVAAFEIRFKSSKPQHFSNSLAYSINGQYTYSISVSGEVIPVVMSISSKQVQMVFRPEQCRPYASEHVIITNKFQQQASFSSVVAPPFFLAPQSGTVPPNGQTDLEIKFFPDIRQTVEGTIVIKVENGEDIILPCKGEVPPTSLSFVSKRIDFGVVAVGTKKALIVKLKNESSNDAFFQFDKDPSCTHPDVTMIPEDGCVLADQTMDVKVILDSHSPQTYDTNLKVNVCGKKPLRLAVAAISNYPTVSVKEQLIDFGEVFLGSSVTKIISLENTSRIPAIVSLDFSNHPEFSVSCGSENDDKKSEDTRSVCTEVATAPASIQESIRLVSNHEWNVFISPGQIVSCQLSFSPSNESNFAFDLPIRVLGQPQLADKKEITALGVRPQVFPSEQHIDFGTQVLLKKDATPHQKALTLTNSGEKEVCWRLEIPQSAKGLFLIEPSNGTLEGKKTAILSVSFCPVYAGVFEEAIPLILLGNDNGNRTDLQRRTAGFIKIKGAGSPPKITFNVPEVRLPVVPLNIKSSVSFVLNTIGYSSTEITCRMLVDKMHVPLSISFPEGNKVVQSKPSLKVEATFQANKPLSFTTVVVFIDDSKNEFPLTISGISDNSLFTIASTPEYYFQRLPTTSSSTSSGKQVISDPVSILNGFLAGGISPPSDFSTSQRELFPPEFVEDIRTWLNSNALRTPIKDFPYDLASGGPKTLLDMLEILSGRKVSADVNKIITSSTAIVGKEQQQQPRTAEGGRKMHRSLRQCTAALDFLRTSGALLGNIRPEHLLSFEEFVKSKGLSEQQKIEGVSAIFPLVSMQAWMAVICQSIRVFVLGKITWKSYKSTPGVVDQAKSETAIMKNNNPPSSTSPLSMPEMLLLRWMTVHLEKIFGGNTSSSLSPSIPAAFNETFFTPRVLSALLLSHIPSLDRLKPISSSISEKDVYLEQFATVLSVMKEVGLDYSVSPQDLVIANPLTLVLLAHYLYSSLPFFIPTKTIHFEPHLNETSTKHIEISNPLNKPITYTVRLEGSQYFSVSPAIVTVEKQGKATLSVSFLSPFVRPANARLMILPKSSGITHVNPLVFLLSGIVTASAAIVLPQQNATLYQHLEISLQLENPLPAPGRFRLSVSQEESGGGGSESMQTKAGVIESSFWCPAKEIALKQGEKIAISVHFLPFRIGSHKAKILCSDDTAGEFFAEVSCLVSAPPALAVFRWACEENTTVEREISIASRNALLDKALETLKLLESPKFTRSPGNVLPPIDIPSKLSIEYSSPFFSGPESIILPQRQPRMKSVSSQQSESKLQISFHPKSAGVYPCAITLKSSTDMRVFQIEGKSQTKTQQISLEFSIPCRQVISQDIPITNNSNQDWNLQAEISGPHFFGPSTISIPPKRTIPYVLQFRPPNICSVTGTLVLTNRLTFEKYTFSLKGLGLEPLPEDKISIETKTREKTALKLPIRNVNGQSITLKVESDMDCVSGKESITLSETQPKLDYELTILPKSSGMHSGSVSFVAPDGNYIWYAIEVKVTPPDCEATIPISTKIRQAVVVSIPIGNPDPERAVSFDVSCTGSGLLGESTIVVPPMQTATYRLVYSPVIATKEVGSVIFFSETVGEFWFMLQLKALPADPIDLQDFICEVGKSQSQPLTLSNPLDEPVIVKAICSNSESFHVDPPIVTLEPLSKTIIEAIYHPSTLQQSENTTISVQSDKMGEWLFRCKGQGIAPTLMDPTTIIGGLHDRTKCPIRFSNPFGEELHLSTSLTCQTIIDQSSFTLEGEIKSVVLPPHQTHEFVVVFSPKSMNRAACHLVLARTDGLKWEFPILGIPELVAMTPCWNKVIAARQGIVEKVDVSLGSSGNLGALLETDLERINFSIDNWKSSQIEASKKSLSISIISISKHERSDTTNVNLEVLFSPMRCLQATAQLIFNERDGGRWIFPIVIEATQPHFDDTLLIEAELGKTAGISFRICSPQHFKEPSPFTATIVTNKQQTANESCCLFAVLPQSGVFPAWKQTQSLSDDGVLFQVMFTPYKRIPAQQPPFCADLNIECEDMQWIFHLEGKHPVNQYSQTTMYIKQQSKKKSTQIDHK